MKDDIEKKKYIYIYIYIFQCLISNNAFFFFLIIIVNSCGKGLHVRVFAIFDQNESENRKLIENTLKYELGSCLSN